MAVELVFAPEVELDIEDAYQWYEDRRVGLGEEFLGCVEAGVHYICRLPELHAKVTGDCRRVLLRRFPYAIFYEYRKNTVTVYSVFHTSQHPEKWKRRLLQ